MGLLVYYVDVFFGSKAMRHSSDQQTNKKSFRVAGVLVTYFPEEGFFKKFLNYISEVDVWCIVDNGSGPTTSKNLDALEKQFPTQVKIIKNHENYGLATAQNQACNWAEKNHFDFFYFLDQDSVPLAGSVNSLKTFFKEVAPSRRIGIIGSHVIHSSGKTQKYWIHSWGVYRRKAIGENEAYLDSVNAVISSGSLLPVQVWKNAGPFMDSYFIDYIDIEYCLRLRRLRYDILVLREARILHQLGGSKKIEGGQGMLYSTFHSPFRRFMMTRNRVRTWKSYILKFPGWFFVDLGNFIFDVFRIIVVEEQTWVNLRAIGRGLLGYESFLFREKKK